MLTPGASASSDPDPDCLSERLAPTEHAAPAEWYFRSSLDRYVWIFGMVCAWAHPHANAALEAMDGLQLRARLLLRAAVLAAVGVLGFTWCVRLPRC